MIELIFLVIIALFLGIPFIFKNKHKSENSSYLLKNIDITKNDDLKKFFFSNLGRLVCASPPDQRINIDYTTKLGKGIKIYYGFAFQVPKWDYNIVKFDEYMDVSSVYQQYYQLTKSHKDALEGKIKSGLADVARAIGDYELIKHDLRKYMEFKNIFDKNDEHSLKTLFVDQVDYHAGSVGQGPGRLSMAFMRQNNIMPTIVQDFLQINSEEDLDKGMYASLPNVEKDMLRTKWRAYQRWKEMFGKEIDERYQRIKELVEARKASIDEYRQWLKPLMAEHRFMKTSLSNPESRKKRVTSFVHGAGIGTSVYDIKLWVWKPISVEEIYQVPGEIYAKKPIRPDDEWTRKELIFDKHKGLIVEFPWITEDWVDSKVKEIISSGLIASNKYYYSFYEVSFSNTVFRFADNTELDDNDITLVANLLSQNVLLVKLLELKAKEEELERYINRMLGLPNKESKIIEYEKKFGKYRIRKIDSREIDAEKEEKEFKKSNKDKYTPRYIFSNIKKMKSTYNSGYVFVDVSKKHVNPFTTILSYYGLNFNIFRRGPYEMTPKDRLWKFYAKQMGSGKTAQLIGHLKNLTNIGR